MTIKEITLEAPSPAEFIAQQLEAISATMDDGLAINSKPWSA
jgi:hypothetical protein